MQVEVLPGSHASTSASPHPPPAFREPHDTHVPMSIDTIEPEELSEIEDYRNYAYPGDEALAHASREDLDRFLEYEIHNDYTRDQRKKLRFCLAVDEHHTTAESRLRERMMPQWSELSAEQRKRVRADVALRADPAHNAELDRAIDAKFSSGSTEAHAEACAARAVRAHLVRFNHVVPDTSDPSGRTIAGELDVETPFAIGEVTVARNGKTAQMEKYLESELLNPSRKPPILLAENYQMRQWRDMLDGLRVPVVRTRNAFKKFVDISEQNAPHPSSPKAGSV